MFLKIGELARRTGLTVRALRHYDDIGLLVPSDRSTGGYRLYTGHDVARLYRIQALRRLDLSLADIQRLLDSGNGDVSGVVAAQVEQLERDIVQATALRDQLLAVQAQLQSNEEPDINDWLATLESMVAGWKYFSREDWLTLKARRGDSGDVSAAERTGLLTRLQGLATAGAPPDGDDAQALATRLIDLLLKDAGGDEGLLMKMFAMQWNEPSLHALTGVDRTGMSYLSRAMAFARIQRYAPYCTADEMAILRQHIAARNEGWLPLIGAVRQLQQMGAPAQGPEARALAQHWQAMALAAAGGNQALHEKVQAAARLDPTVLSGTGIDAGLFAYVDAALAHIDAAPNSFPPDVPT